MRVRVHDGQYCAREIPPYLQVLQRRKDVRDLLWAVLCLSFERMLLEVMVEVNEELSEARVIADCVEDFR